MIKLIQKLSILAVGSLAVILLLGTSLAQAEEVCVNGNTATGIKGLQLVTDQFGQVVVDVDFKYATGFDVYGPNLDGFPFTLYGDEDGFIAMETINNTLNLNAGPVPDFVGLSGINTFYIGVEKETGLNEGLIAAWGGANYTGEHWEPCEEEGLDSCVLGAALVNASETRTYADLTLADGSSCDAGPPPTGFNIVPGISGSWYDPMRNFEGYAFEVIGTPGNYFVNAYFYTYDEVGNQMWVNGVGEVDGDTVVVPMIVTSGAVFGPDFDTDDVKLEEWGTMTFTFSSCISGSGSYQSIMGNGLIEFSRLTSIAGVACP